MRSSPGGMGIRRLRSAGISGTTTLRGIWGFHGDHAPHGDRLLQLGRHVPTVTIVIDTPERIATAGERSGEIVWRPRQDAPWLGSAAGTLSMRFDDGVAHRPDSSSAGQPLGLLVVPALLASRPCRRRD